MSMTVLVMGESGSGKSTSLRNLNPDETYLILSIDKPLPFRNKYKKTITNAEGVKIPGNLFVSDDYEAIIKAIEYLDKNRPEIKNIIIDDFQYVMANEFMRRASEKGYQKFTDLAKNSWEIVRAAQYCKNDQIFFFLTHSDMDQNGKYKAKMIGKMLDEKITFEGMFTIVLHSKVIEHKNLFLTQNDGAHIAKSPMDMFDKSYIPNDLEYVREKIHNYYADIEQDIPQ